MPFVRIELTRGVERAHKRALVEEVTSALVRILGKQPEHIHVVIDEHEEENWGFAGMLTDEFWRSRELGAPGEPEPSSANNDGEDPNVRSLV